MRRAFLVLVLILVPAAHAACEAPEGGASLSVRDFAEAHFADFTVSGGQNRAEFRGSVCLEAADGSWELRGDVVQVTGLQEGDEVLLSAERAELRTGPWRFSAEVITAEGDSLTLSDAVFRSEDLSGSASELLVDAGTGEAVSVDFAAEGPGYRLSGSSARFSGDALHVSVAAITTCLCPGDPFYVIRAREADVDLQEDAVLTLRDGAVQLRGLTVPLKEELQVVQSEFADLKPPFTVEWNPAAPADEPRGRGFSVLVPPFSVAEDATVEFGLTGLDRNHPLSGYFLFAAQSGPAALLAGYTRGGGPRADFKLERKLHDHFRLVLGVNNRHYEDEDYLHEGYVRLETAFPAQKGSGGSRFDWSASLTAALSSQIQPGGTVISPRFRSAVSADWRLPETPAGRFRLRLDSDLSACSGGREQYGLRIRPGWTGGSGPFSFSLQQDWRFTDSGSPFTTNLDRLKPRNVTAAEVRLDSRPVGEDTTLDARVAASWDWLPGWEAGFTDLQASAALTGSAGDWTVRPRLKLQLADLVHPHGSEKTDAYLEGAVTVTNGALEFGFTGRQAFGGAEGSRPDLLELSAAWPYEHGRVRFVPFLAVDLVPALVNSEPPAISGHGLEVAWDSGCGLFRFGYRVHDGEITTSLSAEFIRED